MAFMMTSEFLTAQSIQRQNTEVNLNPTEKTPGERRAQAERRLKGMKEAAERGTVPLHYVEIGIDASIWFIFEKYIQ